MTIQRLKNLRLMTQRYLVLAVVGGWMQQGIVTLWLSSYVWASSVPLTHFANTLCNHVYISCVETSFLKKGGHRGTSKS